MRSRQVLSAGEESRRISWWKVVVGRSGEGRGWKAGMGRNNEARQGSSGMYYMLILISFANAGQCSARVEWVCRVSLQVRDWRRETGIGIANADKASVSATSWLQGGCSCTDNCPAITPFSR